MNLFPTNKSIEFNISIEEWLFASMNVLNKNGQRVNIPPKYQIKINLYSVSKLRDDSTPYKLETLNKQTLEEYRLAQSNTVKLFAANFRYMFDVDIAEM